MRKYLIVVCASFTACVLAFSMFSKLAFMMPVDSAVIFQLFIICVSISFIMFVFEKLTEKYNLPLLVDCVSGVFICYLVVGVEGLAFGMLPRSWISLAYISIVIIPSFIVTYAIVYFTSVKYANDINEQIEKLRKK
jgi:hypothetical protein